MPKESRTKPKPIEGPSKNGPPRATDEKPIAFDAVQKSIDQLEGGTPPMAPDGKDPVVKTTRRVKGGTGPT